MSVEIKKLEIQLKENHDHTTVLLQTLLETVDHIVEENKLQGEDLARNTKAIKLMEVDMEEMRRKLDKQGERVENAAEAGAKQAVKEDLSKAVNKGISNIIEPKKKKFSFKKPRFRFWRRG